MRKCSYVFLILNDKVLCSLPSPNALMWHDIIFEKSNWLISGYITKCKASLTKILLHYHASIEFVQENPENVQELRLIWIGWLLPMVRASYGSKYNILQPYSCGLTLCLDCSAKTARTHGARKPWPLTYAGVSRWPKAASLFGRGIIIGKRTNFKDIFPWPQVSCVQPCRLSNRLLCSWGQSTIIRSAMIVCYYCSLLCFLSDWMRSLN